MQGGTNCRTVRRIGRGYGLVVELAVGVLAEERLSDSRSSGVLKESQSRIEGVVNLDLAIAANDDDTAVSSGSNDVSNVR